MAKPLSDEYLAMLGIWRKALREGGYELLLPTKSDAVRMRFAFYNAMRPVRKGDYVDPELLDAADKLTVRADDAGHGKGKLVFVLKSKNAMMDVLLQALGDQPLEAPKTAEEAQMDSSLANVLGKLGEAPAAPTASDRVTPYYKR